MAVNTTISTRFNLNPITTPEYNFFNSLRDLFHVKIPEKIMIIPVIHCYESSISMIKAVSNIFYTPLLIVKESTKRQNPTILRRLREMGFSIKQEHDKSFFNKKGNALRLLQEHVPHDHQFIIMDHGGYFATSIKDISIYFGSDRFIGITEHTLNGHYKYAHTSLSSQIDQPILSIAKTEIKSIVDSEISETLAHAIDHVVRQVVGVRLNDHNTYKVGIIGYGNLGMGIAQSLKEKSIQGIKVCEYNPIKKVKALSSGFSLYSIDEICRNCNVIISATGNKAIKLDHLQLMQNETFISTVTSPDDEFDFNHLKSNDKIYKVKSNEFLSHYRLSKTNNNIFFILNGQASNLLMKNGISRPSLIYLVESMQLLSNLILATNRDDKKKSIEELTLENQQMLCELWLKYFENTPPVSERTNNIIPLRGNKNGIIQYQRLKQT